MLPWIPWKRKVEGAVLPVLGKQGERWELSPEVSGFHGVLG